MIFVGLKSSDVCAVKQWPRRRRSGKTKFRRIYRDRKESMYDLDSEMAVVFVFNFIIFPEILTECLNNMFGIGRKFRIGGGDVRDDGQQKDARFR